MPTLPDGTRQPERGDRRAAGWLSGHGDHPQGPVGEPYAHLLFRERLFEACRAWVVDATGDPHACPLCPPGTGPVTAEWHGRTARLGAGEIRARDSVGDRWVAPTLVYHYVTAHDYRPPAGFVDALTAGTVEPPDRPPVGTVRAGAVIGTLAALDPELDAEVRRETGTDTAVEVRDAERYEEPGVWRPVLAWARAGAATTDPPVTYDGGDSWRAAVRAWAEGTR